MMLGTIPDITSVVMSIIEFGRTTYWTFNMFGRSWSMTFMQIWLICPTAFLTIKIIKHIYEVVNL